MISWEIVHQMDESLYSALIGEQLESGIAQEVVCLVRTLKCP